jgi:nicotinamide phosphoribosyltransferase
MNNSQENFILLTDSYKLTHAPMYVDNTENVYSYFESRVGAKYPFTTFIGLQPYLIKYFEGSIITQQDVDEADEFSKAHFGMDNFNREMWQHIVTEHDGRLPIRIKAVPEGLSVPTSNVLFTVEATDKKCAALVSPCETILTHIWYPSNVATISRDIRNYLKKAFDKTVDDDFQWLIDFMLHDFGFRGVSSVESAGMGSLGHQSIFKGTDTIHGITYVKRFYNATEMPAFSVPASEHSVMTSLGEDGEFEMVRRLIKKYPTGILSVVSDSYNIERAIKTYGTTLKEEILARDGKFVVRPDSPRFKGDKPYNQIIWIAQELEKYFGTELNKKGYKVLNPKVGIIYGDGLSVDEIKESVDALINVGFSASTSVFGQGGGLLQKHNRDTQRSAFKCSAQQRNGKWVDIYKKPLDITKASKKGRLKLVWAESAHGSILTTVSIDDPRQDVMQTVFENGVITKKYTWDEVRENTKIRLMGE